MMRNIDTLCIVDDDALYQMLTKIIIERTQIVQNFKMFSNGKEAITFLDSKKDMPECLPEVILLDLNMPVLDGWGFLKEYLELKPRMSKEIVIYVVSSSIDPEDIQRARSINEVTDFIVKPVTQEKFINLVENLSHM